MKGCDFMKEKIKDIEPASESGWIRPENTPIHLVVDGYIELSQEAEDCKALIRKDLESKWGFK